MQTFALSGALLLLSIILYAPLTTAAQKVSKTSKNSRPANTEPKDVLGWQDTKWGMTKVDIKRVFARYNVSKDRQADDEPRLICETLCALLNFKIANEAFMVTFEFDGRTNGLSEVSLDNINAKYRESFVNELEKLLILKYGASDHVEDGTVGSLMDLSRYWGFKTTEIRLRHRHTLRDSTSMTQISFKPSRSSEMNKL